MLKQLFVLSLYVLVLYVLYRMFLMNYAEPFQTYDQCRNLGYSKSFCVQTPTSVFGPAGCMCPDGSMGQVYPGLRGGCMCHNSHYVYVR